MQWLADPGDRRGTERVGYLIGRGIALVVTATVVAAPLAWWLVQVLR